MSGAFGAISRPTRRECPCGGYPSAGATYGDCWGRLHEGAAAASAEALMRSRYAAFALGDVAYLLRSWHARTRPASLTLDADDTWTGLEVLDTAAGGPADDEGTVTYRARRQDASGATHTMRETARFIRRAGRWVYLDGDVG